MGWRNLRKGVLVAGAIAGGAIAMYIPTTGGGGPGPAPSGSANVWVDTNGGNCTYQPTAGAYSDAGACVSMDAALATCNNGDTIRMLGGSYPAQSPNEVKTCTLIGDTTTPVTMPDLNVSGANYTVENIVVDSGLTHGVAVGAGGTNITARNLKLHGAYISMTGAGSSGFIWDGGELGEVGAEGLPRVCGQDLEPAQLQDLTNFTIDGVTFYPQNADTTPSACSSNGFHLETIRLDHGVDGFTLRNSVFADGQNSNSNTLFLSETTNGHPNGEPRNLTFANNYFGSDNKSTFGVNFTVDTCLNWTIAYNTFVNAFGSLSSSGSSNGCTTVTNVIVVGNLGSINTVSPCTGTHLKNRWQASGTFSCGTDQTTTGTNFSVDQLGVTSGTGRLTNTSVARNGGETTYCASALGNLDFEGETRPQGAANCDNGFDEVN